MLSLIARMIAGPTGGYVMAAVGGAFALTAATAGVQSIRVDRLKDDVREARAALKDPVTGKPWKDLAAQAQGKLGRCGAELSAASGALEAQNQAVEALRQDGLRREREMSKALLAARNQAKAAQSAADRILTARVTGEDTCKRLLQIEAVITAASG